ncbi:uncharacterized protein TRIVIDRAFT_136338, partial [Trichoderma virens Gv29-8]
EKIRSYIQSELQASVLDQLAPHLWLFSRKSGSHINALHQLFSKTRKVVIIEDPGLHLVWHEDVFYVKPIPNWLLCSAVWDQQLIGLSTVPSSPSPASISLAHCSDLTKSAIGFLRSYSWLIRHPSDFALARQANLVPEGIDGVDFETFIRTFRTLPDAAVTERYHYGQLRLSRLHLATRLVRPVSVVGMKRRKIWWYYHETRWTAGQYFRDYITVFITAFAVLSLALSGMQVALAVDVNQRALARGFWGLAIAVVV